MNFLVVKNQNSFHFCFTSKSCCTATMAARVLGGWNFETIQFLNRGVMGWNFQEASLKTVDFPQDELFESQKSIFVSKFFASRIDCTTTMAAQGLGGWNFEEIQFLNREVMCRNFQEASLKTVDFPQDELFGSKKIKIFSIFFYFEKFLYCHDGSTGPRWLKLWGNTVFE